MPNKRFLLHLLWVFMAACSTKTTVQVARHPLIQFTYNSLIWQDNNYIFSQPVKVVAYPADTLLPGGFYSRYSLQAFGQDSKGNNLQLNIAFDASDPTQLVGLYRTAYTKNLGLASAQLFNLDNNNLSEYSLSANDTTSFLQILRQSQSEMLISGIFQLTLNNTRDTTQKIMITNGTLTDINY